MLVGKKRNEAYAILSLQIGKFLYTNYVCTLKNIFLLCWIKQCFISKYLKIDHLLRFLFYTFAYFQALSKYEVKKTVNSHQCSFEHEQKINSHCY